MALDYSCLSDTRKERISDIVELSEDAGRKPKRLKLIRPLEEKVAEGIEETQTGWRYLDHLGAEYHTLVEKGYGTSVENRTSRQEEIARILVESTAPYITQLVKMIVKGPGIEIRQYGQKRVFKIRGSKTHLHDLIQEGMAAFYQNLQKYNPERGSMSTFIPYAMLKHLYLAANENRGLLILPQRLASKVEKIIAKSIDYRDAIEKIMETVTWHDGEINWDVASTLYHGVKNDRINIWQPIKYRGNCESKDLFEGRHLKNGAESPEETVSKNVSMKAALSQLSPVERTIVQARYGFIDGIELERPELAKKLGITRQRVGQLEKQALQRLRDILTQAH